MTSRQVALLRGINVGGHQKVSMARLRELLESLGYQAVKTHLQSGNAVFTNPQSASDQAAADIERSIATELGLTVPVLVRTRDDLARVVAGRPWAGVATDPVRLLVAFLSDRLDPKTAAALDADEFAPERFHLGDQEMYLWCPNGIANSGLAKMVAGKRLGVVATARNWNTVTKLLELADA